MRKLLAIGVLVVLVGAAMTAVAATGTRVEMKIVDRGEAVVGAQVAVFMSCDKLQGTTGEGGRVTLESACNAGYYWVEINGRRVSELFAVQRDVRTIDLATVSYAPNRGGR